MMDEQDLIQALRAPWPSERRHRPGLDPSRPGFHRRVDPDGPGADGVAPMRLPYAPPGAQSHTGRGRRRQAPSTTALVARLVAGVAIVALAAAGLFFVGGQGPSPVPTVGVTSPSPANPSAPADPTRAPARLRSGSLPAGTYVTAPFAQPGSDACIRPPLAGCWDVAVDDSIRIAFTVPDGWFGYGSGGIYPDHAPQDAGLVFVRGGALYSDPCHDDAALPDIPVGPTAADLAEALATHPLLDVTSPVDVTLAGYTGKYLELQVSGTLECGSRAWDLGLEDLGYFGRPAHLWILDVDGLRVVIQAMEVASTSPTIKAQLRAIVDSISIEPATAPAPSSSPGPLAWSPASAERDWPAPVRTEPAGDPVVVPLADRRYTDPSGDIASPDTRWIDIQGVTVAVPGGSVLLGIAAGAPHPPAGSNEPWIAYGVVLDTDFDGVADVRIGMDVVSGRWNKGEPRVWRTDLHTGRTQSGFQVGPVWLCDCSWPGGSEVEPGATAKMHWVLGVPGRLGDPDVPTRLYAWASVIQDGRVVTDYAPDTGWFDTSPPVPRPSAMADR